MIDFLIANTGHHLEAAAPVAHKLIQRGLDCRLVSLCELRGGRSPVAGEESQELAVHRIVPHDFRRAPSRAGTTPPRSLRFRELPRRLFWHFYLARRVRSWLHSGPHLVTVPNDAAFPYNRICRELRRGNIPFLVLQEGIRFGEAAIDDTEILAQGLSGANAIACWGHTSADYFRARGAPPQSIHLTGSPRFDRLQNTDWSAEAESLARSLPPGKATLSVVTNPVEVWGFCSRSGKMEMLQSFLDGLVPLFEEQGLRVIFKIHRQESLRDYRALVESHSHARHMAVLENAPLYPLLRLSNAVVILASTVGLEALLLRRPLGVLEMPGVGFVHDFVSSGTARGISWRDPIAGQIAALLQHDPSLNPALAAYLDRTLSARGRATEAVAALVESLARGLAATPGQPGGTSVVC